MNSVGQSSLQFIKTVHLYNRERHLCLQVSVRMHVIPPPCRFQYIWGWLQARAQFVCGENWWRLRYTFIKDIPIRSGLFGQSGIWGAFWWVGSPLYRLRARVLLGGVLQALLRDIIREKLPRTTQSTNGKEVKVWGFAEPVRHYEIFGNRTLK